MICRFIAKGRDIARLTLQTIAAIEAWLNNYPRRILGFKTPNLLFQDELKATA